MRVTEVNCISYLQRRFWANSVSYLEDVMLSCSRISLWVFIDIFAGGMWKRARLNTSVARGDLTSKSKGELECKDGEMLTSINHG